MQFMLQSVCSLRRYAWKLLWFQLTALQILCFVWMVKLCLQQRNRSSNDLLYSSLFSRNWKNNNKIRTNEYLLNSQITHKNSSRADDSIISFSNSFLSFQKFIQYFGKQKLHADTGLYLATTNGSINTNL